MYKFFNLTTNKTIIAAATLLLAAGCANGNDGRSPGWLLGLGSSTTKTSSIAAQDDQLRFASIDKALQEEVDNNIRAGFVARIVTSQGPVYETAIGMADRENGLAMASDTRFRIASMTKPIVSAAIMRLVDDGKVRLNDPVSKFIPAFANARVATSTKKRADGTYATRPANKDITVHHLLTHTAGLGYAFLFESDLDKDYLAVNPFFTSGTLEERIDLIASLPLYVDPGVTWIYSYATDVLGRVIEVASGSDLETYLRQTFFDPLGMNDTAFLLDQDDFNRVATVYGFDETGELIPADTSALGADVNSTPFGIMSGGGGLISNAPDYGRFCQMLLNGGAFEGGRVLSEASVRLLMTNALPEAARTEEWRRTGLSFTLGGLIVLEPGYTGRVATEGGWGWGGYWDTYFVINRKDDVGVIVMTQTQPGPLNPTSRANDIVRAVAYAAAKKP